MTRALALVALLLTGAVQAQEAGHWHELDGSYVECLLCKSGSDVPLANVAIRGTALWVVVITAEPALTAPAIGIVTHSLARGPPAYS